jgi:D-arabinose 1-dehydrogenase-like Zn-dependent alcohol dehydrogenase
MKAAILHSLNSKWEIRETQTPKPSPNQVLIKINASGLCYSDVHITEGGIPFPLNFPLIIGHEPAGEIVEVGESVTTRKKGDRVGYLFCKKHVADVNGVSEEKEYFVNSNKEQE